jgi:hypothetical protein
MLINKPAVTPKEGDVITVRLVSGEEIIATLVGEGTDGLTVKSPISAVMQATASGEIGLAFAPFLASSEEFPEVVFPLHAIAMRPVKTRDDVAKGYKSATKPASAIIQPNRDLFIP